MFLIWQATKDSPKILSALNADFDRCELEMNITLCTEIIEKNFPQIHIEYIKQIFGGWDSEVFEVNGELIFRFPKRLETESMIQKEIIFLPELAKVLSVLIPDFEFIGEHDKKVFVGYRKVLGLPLSSCDYSSGNLADQVAKVITEIHSFPVHKATELKVPNINWRRDTCVSTIE